MQKSIELCWKASRGFPLEYLFQPRIEILQGVQSPCGSQELSTCKGRARATSCLRAGELFEVSARYGKLMVRVLHLVLSSHGLYRRRTRGTILSCRLLRWTSVTRQNKYGSKLHCSLHRSSCFFFHSFFPSSAPICFFVFFFSSFYSYALTPLLMSLLQSQDSHCQLFLPLLLASVRRTGFTWSL